MLLFFVSFPLLLCGLLILLFLLLKALFHSTTLVRSLLFLYTTPGFQWRADRLRKALLDVFQHDATSERQVEGEERKGIKGVGLLKSCFLSDSPDSCGLEGWVQRAQAAGFKSTMRSSQLSCLSFLLPLFFLPPSMCLRLSLSLLCVYPSTWRL